MKPIKVNCAVCGKPVDRVETYFSDWDYKLYITVECHGETETTAVSGIAALYSWVSVLAHIKQNELEGVAFDKTSANTLLGVM